MLKVLVLFTPHHGLQCTSQKESNILLCSKVLYFISYYILCYFIYNSTLCKYYSIYTIFYSYLQYLICTVRIQIHLFSLGVPTSTTAAATIVILLLCHRVLEEFPDQKGPKDSKNFICSRCVSAGEPGLDGISNEY